MKGSIRYTLACAHVSLVLGAFAACSGKETRPSAIQGTGKGSASTASGGGDDGQGGEPGSGGHAGTHVAGVLGCGDGIRVSEEECDGEDLGGATCASLGFDEGSLSCALDCTLDPRECSGSERCADGFDNDNDGDVDCEDDLDCWEACSDPCYDPQALLDPSEVTVSMRGRGGLVAHSACLTGVPDPGPGVVYRFTAESAGKLELELESDASFYVSVRTTCGDAVTESACADRRLSLPVEEGDELLIVVEAVSANDEGPFTLSALSRPSGVCGDGYRDESEECDDRGLEPLDGCDDDCNLESDETEPNESTSGAAKYGNGYFASIDPAGDEDLIAVVVPAGPGSISARTRGFVDECESGRVDTVLELLDTDGLTLLDDDDDGGEFYCSRVLAAGLDAGTYYLRVAASSAGDAVTFPYEVVATVNSCGDGILGPGETCDDYNQEPGDGCSASCKIE